MTSAIVSVLLGVLSGLAAWWLITRLPIPRLEASPICRTERAGRAPRYRIKVVNLGRWPLPHRPGVDVRVRATLRVRGLNPGEPGKWNNFDVPLVNDGRVPLLEHNTIVTLHPEWMEIAKRPGLSKALGTKDPAALDLERMLDVGLHSELRLLVTASDVYTHATGTRVFKRLRADIRNGRLVDEPGRAGLRIEAAGEELEAQGGGAALLIGPPGAGKSSVLEALGTLLERRGVEHGAIESEELARGFPPLGGESWTAALGDVLARQRRAGRELFLIAATPETQAELHEALVATAAERSLVVCLHAPAELLAARLQRREPDRWPGKPGLIAHARELAETIPRLDGIEARIDTSEREPEDVAREVVGLMERCGLLGAGPRPAA